MQPARQTNWPDLLAGLAVAGVGLFIAYKAQDYRMGTLARPGPGFVPQAVGLLIAALGLGCAFVGARAAPESRAIRLRPLAAVSLGMIGFALTVETAGFVPATLLLVLVAGLGEARSGWFSLLGVAVAVCILGVGLFIELLGVPLRAFGGG